MLHRHLAYTKSHHGHPRAHDKSTTLTHAQQVFECAHIAAPFAPLNRSNVVQELPRQKVRLQCFMRRPLVFEYPDACPCRTVVQEFRPTSWHARYWLAAGIALIVLQHLATALQLRSSLLGRSLSLPRLPKATYWPPSTVAGRVGTWAALLAAPLLMDLAAIWVLLRGTVPWLQWADNKRSTAWVISYARRRLGLAGVLQAAPQAFFHCYILLLCYWRDECSAPRNPFTLLGVPVAGHHRPSAVLLRIAVGLDFAVIALSLPGISEVARLGTNWLTWGAWGALLRESLDSALYIADIGFDVVFVVVSAPCQRW
jgi:hypothetical protein